MKAIARFGSSTKRQRLKFLTASFLAALLLSCGRAKQTVPQKAIPEPPLTRLAFAGDVMFSRGVRREILAAHDPAMPLRKIAPLLAGSDISFVNLESPFSDQGPYYDGGLIFHSAPDTIEGLVLAGVRLASTANNHARDCGAHGVAYTVAWLREHGILAVGSSESAAATHAGVVLSKNGIRWGFLGYTYDQSNGNWRDLDDRIAVADQDALCRDVRSLKQRADVVIVSMHHGIEYMSQPSKAQIGFAHAAIDAGAALVIGHHPHVVEPREEYHGGLIFYSLGNFVFDQYQREQTQHGQIVQISFLGKRVLATHIEPVRITPTGPELESPDALMNDGRLLDVAAELRTHRRKDLLRERMLTP